jgi:hypothetical protein
MKSGTIFTTEQQNMKRRRDVEGTSTHTSVVEGKIIDKPKQNALITQGQRRHHFHPFFILVLYGGELSASLYSCFTPEPWEPLNRRVCELQNLNVDCDVRSQIHKQSIRQLTITNKTTEGKNSLVVTSVYDGRMDKIA